MVVRFSELSTICMAVPLPQMSVLPLSALRNTGVPVASSEASPVAGSILKKPAPVAYMLAPKVRIFL